MQPTDKKGEVQTGYFVEFIPGWWSRKGDGPATRNSLSGQVYHGSVTKEQVEQLTQIVRDFLNGKSAPSAALPTIYSAAESLEGGKVRLHLAPPPIWDGEIRFDSDCILNGVLVQAGTTWNVLLHREKK